MAFVESWSSAQRLGDLSERLQTTLALEAQLVTKLFVQTRWDNHGPNQVSG
jgi:hypothetical protein